MIKKILLCAAMAMACNGASAFTYDGKYQASEYSSGGGVAFNVDYGVATGGQVAISAVVTDGSNFKQYMYFAHPRGFLDLSWGGDDQVVGWGSGGQGDLGGRVGSEFFAFSLERESGATYQIVLDPGSVSDGGTDDKDMSASHLATSYVDKDGDPILGPNLGPSEADDGERVAAGETTTVDDTLGSGSVLIGFKSTLDYNNLVVGGAADWVEQNFEDDSPTTVADTDGDCDGDESSHADCYTLAQPGGEVNAAGWVYDFGVEIEFTTTDSNGFFDLTSFGNPDDAFAYQQSDTTGLTVISLDALHASPSKPLCLGNDEPSPGGTAPCDGVTVTGTGTVTVPAPGTFALLGLGFVGMLAARRRRRLHSSS